MNGTLIIGGWYTQPYGKGTHLNYFAIYALNVEEAPTMTPPNKDLSSDISDNSTEDIVAGVNKDITPYSSMIVLSLVFIYKLLIWEYKLLSGLKRSPNKLVFKLIEKGIY